MNAPAYYPRPGSLAALVVYFFRANAGADPTPDEPATPARQPGALGIDARVKVLPSATGKKEAPWVGKTGIVERQVGPEAWDVHFMPGTAKLVTGKAAGVLQSFHASELEVVEGAA